MRTREALATLIEELEGDAREIERLRAFNTRGWDRIREGADDLLDYAALAFTIHTVYNVLENYFLRVSKFFENDLPPQAWHKTLVDRMALEIPELRPALLTSAGARQAALELLRFRHKYRHLYGEDLDPERTLQAQQVLAGFLDEFPAMHRAFVGKLKSIGELL